MLLISCLFITEMANSKKKNSKKSPETENSQSAENAPPAPPVVPPAPPSVEDTVAVPQVSDPPVEPGTQELFTGDIETQASAGDWGDSECPRDLPETPRPPTMFSEDAPRLFLWCSYRVPRAPIFFLSACPKCIVMAPVSYV